MRGQRIGTHVLSEGKEVRGWAAPREISRLKDERRVCIGARSRTRKDYRATVRIIHNLIRVIPTLTFLCLLCSEPLASIKVVEGVLASEGGSAGSTVESRINDALASSPVLLLFYAGGCYFCHDQIDINDELEKEYEGQLAFISVDVEKNESHGNQFEVRALPMMFLITDKKGDAYVKQEIAGLTAKENLTKIFAAAGIRPSDDDDSGRYVLVILVLVIVLIIALGLILAIRRPKTRS